jgi:hypothetical protein
VRNDGVLSSSGELYFDNMLLYDKEILAVQNVMKETVKIFPNPTCDIIHVSVASNENPTLQLYFVNGVLLKENKAKEMDVQDISVGTYILKVRIKDNFVCYPVIIVR